MADEKKKFRDWYHKRLIVVGYPSILEIINEGGKFKAFDIIINVSDEFYLDYAEKVISNGKHNYWFPMGESNRDMGLSSIYGAMQVMHQAFQANKTVLVHCHEGRNRSQTIRACFHYMMTGKHLKLPTPEACGNVATGNKLESNCYLNHLPPMDHMESWLLKCKEAFDNLDKFIGGMYDWTIENSKISEPPSETL